MIRLSAAAVSLVLALLLCPLSTPLGADRPDTWIEVRSPNFIVMSNAGDKQARKVAEEFEQIREVFQGAFPKVSVDLGKPVIIFAVKNEESMKLLLPGFWEVNGHVHPAGVYQPGEEKHFVVVRTDMEGPNPHEVVYHEYTHALLNLNFRGLPLWLKEGLAEFFGNSAIHDKYVEIGKIAPNHFRILRENKLIPVDVLLQVSNDSPYYNEANHASLFYAESWTMVHYLMMDPEAQKRNLLRDFLAQLANGADSVEAAKNTFGDLKKFAQTVENYSRQDRLYVGRVKTSIHVNPMSYTSRALPPADVDARRGEFYVYNQRPKEAKAALEAAVQADPNLPLAHEGLGLLAIFQQDPETADAEFERAVQLNSSSFLVYFFRARAKMREGIIDAHNSGEIVADLEKVISLNPQFAPAYATLATFYSVNPETQEKALAAGKKAILLEPGNLSYAIAYGSALLNMGKTADAKILAARIEAAAQTPVDHMMAQQFSNAVRTHEAYGAPSAANMKVPKRPQTDTPADESLRARDESSRPTPAKADSTGGTASPVRSLSANEISGREYELVGKVAGIDCGKTTDGRLTMIVNSVAMQFHYAELSNVRVARAANTTSSTRLECKAWRGLRAKVSFHPAADQGYDGELLTVQFF